MHGALGATEAHAFMALFVCAAGQDLPELAGRSVTIQAGQAFSLPMLLKTRSVQTGY